MRRHFSPRTRWIVSSIISFLAAGSGIIALVTYLHKPTPVLKTLNVNPWVWPQVVRPGEAVTITVAPFAQNEVVIPGVAVVIRNFSDMDDETVGSWVDETPGFTDATGQFHLRFEVPKSSAWTDTKFDISVSKDGYRMDQQEVQVWRKR